MPTVRALGPLLPKTRQAGVFAGILGQGGGGCSGRGWPGGPLRSEVVIQEDGRPQEVLGWQSPEHLEWTVILPFECGGEVLPPRP